jgi:branched-chain amino acid transport system permease protein
VRTGGQAIGTDPPYKLVSLGLGRKFQAATVFDSLTVAESLFLASQRGRLPSIVERTETLALPSAALRVAETTGLLASLAVEAGDLDHGLRQALELTMVLALDPDILLLDEPTSGLTAEERAMIADVITDLTVQEEICVLLIEHDFNFVRQIASRMIVLHEGQVLLDGSVEEVAASEIVQRVYLGRMGAAA